MIFTRHLTTLFLAVVILGSIFFIPMPKEILAEDANPGIAPVFDTSGNVTTGTEGGLVPCGTNEVNGVVLNPCQVCHIFALLQNVLNFLWWDMSVPIAALMFAWGGFLMLFQTTSAGALEKGKKILTNTVIGIAIIFFAWLGVDTIIKIVAARPNYEIGTSRTGIVPQVQRGGRIKFGPWNEIDCPIVGSVVPGGETRPTPPPSSSSSSSRSGTTGGTGGVGGILSNGRDPAAERAQSQAFMNSLRAAGVQFNGVLTSSSCGGVSAQTNADEVAAGRDITVCSSTCTATSGCAPRASLTINPALLSTLQSLKSGGCDFAVTSLATGRHGANSDHYRGDGADIQLSGSSGRSYAQCRNDALSALNSTGGTAICENGDKVITSALCSGADHIHISLPRR